MPAFEHTPLDEIPKIVERVRSTFFTHKTKPIEFRLQQLRKFYWGVVDHEAELQEACMQDLGKGYFESMLSEIKWVENDLIFVQKNLEKWAKDETAPDIDWANKLMSPKIRKDPLGCCLVIGAFNFPVNLSFGPLIGAIAGGNTAILKPSEKAPACAAVMQKVMETSLDPDCYACIQGAVPETKALLAEKWDKIFFTGSAATGKIIAKAAAPTLTPVTLELGGKNPAIITKKADVRLAARRLLWAKVMNAGRVCISQNYLLADKEIVPELISQLKIAMKEFYPNGAKASKDYGRIVDAQAFARIKKMLDNTSGRIVIGGTMDAEQKFIEPTVIEVSDPSDALIAEESFGPLIPILPVDNLDEAIRIANQVHSTPLGIYPFGTKEETDKVLNGVRSGGASVNDGFFHGAIPTLQFGGVGDSGSGAYRGKASFDCFVHRRSFTRTPNWIEGLLSVRYPPFDGKFEKFAKTAVLTPDFDRHGKPKWGVLKYVLTLGTGSKSRGALRAALLVVVAVGARVLMDRKFMDR